MYYNDKEIALNQILKNIQLLENQISEKNLYTNITTSCLKVKNVLQCI